MINILLFFSRNLLKITCMLSLAVGVAIRDNCTHVIILRQYFFARSAFFSRDRGIRDDFQLQHAFIRRFRSKFGEGV